MLPQFISDAKGKHPTFLFNVIRSRMLPQFISDAKGNHPTFIFSVIRSQMLAPFISDAKDKHPTFIFSVIWSRSCLRRRFHRGFLLHNVERNSFRKRMQQHEKNRPKKKKYIYFLFILFLFLFFIFFLGGGAWVRRIYEKLCLDSPRVANLDRCHAYLGCRNMLLRDFHLPLFVTDKWVKCYCELILGLASLLLRLLVGLPRMLPVQKDLVVQPMSLIPHHKVSLWPLSGSRVRRQAFHKELRSSQQRPSGNPLEILTIPDWPLSESGVPRSLAIPLQPL